MWEADTIIIVSVTFVLAGFTKGVVGLGLPTVSLALLTVFFGLKDAMVLMLIPSFVTNVWQALAGPHFRELMRRFWPLMVAGFLGTWATAGLIAKADTAVLTAVLGISIAVYAGFGLSPIKIPNPEKHEGWLSPVTGGVTGALTGLTGSFVVPSVMYFQSLQLPRDYLVQTMGAWFSVATLALGLALGFQDLLPVDHGMVSAAALLPAAFGMIAGQMVRRRLSEQVFRKVFFVSLLLLGSYIIFLSLR
ncbi:MAG TPA: hypothetical protein DCS82_09785 [Rhodospirillaceae bacterium]|nr:hypothetical protein [Rhodospirillaceae bacterium]HAT35996.1 hypothetical protein [Rhodospirillaceae bacterium]